VKEEPVRKSNLQSQGGSGAPPEKVFSGSVFRVQGNNTKQEFSVQVFGPDIALYGEW
jgi:hypothetical protein